LLSCCSKILHGSGQITGLVGLGRIKIFVNYRGSGQKFYQISFCLLENLFVYRDPVLSTLTHHCNVQFTTFNFAAFYQLLTLQFRILILFYWTYIVCDVNFYLYRIVYIFCTSCNDQVANLASRVGSGQEKLSLGQLCGGNYLQRKVAKSSKKS